MEPPSQPTPSVFRSGFVSMIGRPNVGKSTLVNRLVGRKVSIVSDRPQTTRTQIRGVRTTASEQIVFLDTPGVHKPRTLLGERTNDRATSTLAEVDVICFLVEANASIGPGDRFVADLVASVRTPTILVVNKVDAAEPERHRDAPREPRPSSVTSPRSYRSRRAPATAIDALLRRAGDPAARRAALLPGRRRQRPARVLPRGRAPPREAARGRRATSCRTRSRSPPRRSRSATTSQGPLLALRLVVRVERESQKGIVIGRGGAVLKQAGTDARRELEALLGTRIHLETHVKVEPDWQRRAHSLDRLGL